MVDASGDFARMCVRWAYWDFPSLFCSEASRGAAKSLYMCGKWLAKAYHWTARYSLYHNDIGMARQNIICTGGTVFISRIAGLCLSRLTSTSPRFSHLTIVPRSLLVTSGVFFPPQPGFPHGTRELDVKPGDCSAQARPCIIVSPSPSHLSTPNASALWLSRSSLLVLVLFFLL